LVVVDIGSAAAEKWGVCVDREIAAQHRMGFRVLVAHPVIVPRADGLVTATHRSTVLWISSPSSYSARLCTATMCDGLVVGEGRDALCNIAKTVLTGAGVEH
jgi:hypothetical protein